MPSLTHPAPFNLVGLLRQFYIRPDKKLGQNFLIDEAALRRVVEAAEVNSEDVVLEIGPGVGSLTRWLGANAARVTAVEIDGRLRPALESALQDYGNVRLVVGDMLALDPAEVMGDAPGYKVVANIPYYITSAIIRHLLEARVRPSAVVLTVQREVAERITAGPGEMSLLAVSVQFYGVPRVVAHIPAGAFHPRPAVDSAVVRIDLHAEPPVPVASVDDFFRAVKAGFSQKRKQLRNSISAGLAISPADADRILMSAGVDPKRRAETLTLDEWGRVSGEARRS